MGALDYATAIRGGWVTAGRARPCSGLLIIASIRAAHIDFIYFCPSICRICIGKPTRNL